MKKLGTLLIFLLIALIGLGQTTQCKGITQKGTRCKHMTYNANGYCYQHQSQAPKEKRIQKETKVQEKSKSSETYHGHEVHTGPKGGKYYINSSGHKTYIKH